MSPARCRKTTVALYRCSYAICVLAVIPLGIAKTATNPSDYHVILLATSAAWTALVGKQYRGAVRRWEEGGDD